MRRWSVSAPIAHAASPGTAALVLVLAAAAVILAAGVAILALRPAGRSDARPLDMRDSQRHGRHRMPAGLDTPDQNGFTALDGAARRGDVAAIRSLLAAGADRDLRDWGPNGWTALMHAAHKEQAAAVRALLAAGADPNRRSANGATALLIAAGQGEAEIVELLLAAGADPRAKGRFCATVFTDAVTEGDPATIRALRRHAPDLRLGNRPCDWAARLIATLRGRGEIIGLAEGRAEGRDRG
jgi:hypothetical protein